jgi:hypothetical protein
MTEATLEEVQNPQEPVLELEKEVVAENEAIVETNVDDDNDDDIFGAKPQGTAVAQSSDPLQTQVNDLQGKLDAANKTISELNARIAQLDSLSTDPLVDAWGAYKSTAGDEADVSVFLNSIGVSRKADGLSDDETMRAYYESVALSTGISTDELEDAVEESFSEWAVKSRIEKAKSVKEAKEALLNGNKSELQSISAKHKATIEARKKEFKDYSERQMSNLKSVVSTAVSKGSFNGRKITSEWGDKILAKAMVSYDLLNPEFVDFDTEGNINVKDALYFLDEAVFKNELRDVRKKRVNNASVENIEQRAIVAHNTRIDSELKRGKTETEEDAAFRRALESAGRA